MQVDPIEKGPGDALPVAVNLLLRAAACLFAVPVVPARARVQGCDEYKICGKCHAPGGAGDRDASVFEGLSKHFEGGALEFRQFIQEENAVVS
jgi:hypothetical protein